MKSVIFISAFFVLSISFHFSASAQIVTSQTRTDGWTLPVGELKVKLYGADHNASSFYNVTGGLIDRFRDAPDSESVRQSIVREYTVDFTGYTGGMYAEYGLLKNLTMMLDVPVTRWNLHERYAFDSTYEITQGDDKDTVSQFIRRDRAQLNRFQPNYYSIGGRYALTTGNNLVGLSGTVRIPPGFKNKVTADSTGEFIEDEFYEGLLGLNLGIAFNKAWLASNITYNMRGGEYNDDMQYYLEFGSKNVETTQFILFTKYVQSLGSFQNTSNFDPRRRRFQENYFLVGGVFEIEFQKQLSLSAGYDIRLAGKNTWALSAFSIGAGWRFSPDPKKQPSGF
ncbi:MAG: hypothetical protein V4642_05280 [Bacteroidota bacterium]